MSVSTYQEPPAGSMTRARLDSSCRIDWVLRAMRRAKSSGSPMRGVERQHGDRVGAADRGREAARSWCAACSPTGRAGSSSPPTSPRAGAGRRRSATGPGQFGDAVPDPARGPQLGDRQELVGGDREAELERRQRVVDASAPPSVSARR